MPDRLQSDFPPEFAGAMANNALRAMRATRGYSLEELSFTCGLATHELAEIENGRDNDPAKLRRIALALQLPETTFLSS
jgi:transcriptional regulator with XRE-family HTH domain